MINCLLTFVETFFSVSCVGLFYFLGTAIPQRQTHPAGWSGSSPCSSELRSWNRNSNDRVMLGEGEHLLSPSLGITRASPEIPLLAAAGGDIRCVSRGKCNTSAYPQLPSACSQQCHQRMVNLLTLLQRHSVPYTSVIHLFSPLLSAKNNEECEA